MRRASWASGFVLSACALLGAIAPAAGGEEASTATEVAASQSAAGVYTPLGPVRAIDTRSTGKLVGGTVYTADLTGVGVPLDATAVALNVTVTEPVAAGYVTLTPAGGPMPLTSNLNVRPGETTANAAIVAVNSGEVDVMVSVPAHVIFDVAGFWTPASGATAAGRFQPINPVRVLDTRAGGSRIDVAPRLVDLWTAGVPGSARAVVVTLTATEPVGAGYLTAWGSGPLPYVSNLNYGAGQTIANTAIVGIAGTPAGGGGPVWRLGFHVAAAAPTHLVVDVVGWITGDDAAVTTTGQFVAASPVRVLDTRDGTGRLTPPDTVDCSNFLTWAEANEVFWTYVNAGLGDVYRLDRASNPSLDPCESLPGHPGGARPVNPANARVPRRGTVPFVEGRMTSGSAIAFNLTVTDPEAGGYVTAFPSGAAQPWASNVNPAGPGDTRAGLALSGTGPDAHVWLYTSGSTHLVADVAGWFL